MDKAGQAGAAAGAPPPAGAADAPPAWFSAAFETLKASLETSVDKKINAIDKRLKTLTKGADPDPGAGIEHVTAGLAEERRKDREELRGLWRDTERQLDQLTGRVDAIAAHLDTFITESAARDRETDRRFRETDVRIDKMVSAMGEFIRPLSPTAHP